MFDLPSFDEWLLIAVVALVVIGPKDMPMALRTVGRWVAKMRSISNHFRSGVETMIREAELEEMEKKWKEQNDAIMAATPIDPESEAAPVMHAASAEAAVPSIPESNQESSALSETDPASQPSVPL